MAAVTRRIGLSLGADLCWPIAYRAIMGLMNPRIKQGKDTLSFEVENVYIEPFDLQGECPFDVVIDRLTHWYHNRREWIKKSVLLDDLYVFNNPWSVQSMEKHTSYVAMMRLGLPIPRTWMVPPKSYEPSDDLEITLERYARLFDLGQLGERIGYPFFMKPFDGGGWKGVSRVSGEERFQKLYDESGTAVMHLQKSVEPHDRFVRCVGLGPQTRMVLYDPDAPLHDRYTRERNFVSQEDAKLLRDMTLTINTFFGWDFNSCESLRSNGVWHPIDFANPCPDSQVTSLHFHFPWLIMANIRWSVFCAATRRPMRLNLDWQPYFDAVEEGMTLRERLTACVAIADQRLETERFREFCDRHLGNLAEVTHTFFGTGEARDAVRQKVQVMFPQHEVDEFTELFWQRIQEWRSIAAEEPNYA